MHFFGPVQKHTLTHTHIAVIFIFSPSTDLQPDNIFCKGLFLAQSALAILRRRSKPGITLPHVHSHSSQSSPLLPALAAV